MWFLKSDCFKSDFKDCPLVYIPYDEGNTRDDFINFLLYVKLSSCMKRKVNPEAMVYYSEVLQNFIAQMKAALREPASTLPGVNKEVNL